MDENKIKVATITLTQKCNLACTYCYEHYKSQKVIDFETAKAIIDSEFAKLDEKERIEFDLFGGEPFLEFELIKRVTEYICSVKGNKQCQVFATTNGTLVHGEIQEWLRTHSCCFVCGLSLDGTREMHNINRSNSYDDIDLEFFLEMYPEQDVKMTISKETLPNLAEGVIELHRKGFLVSCNLAYQIDWSAKENLELLNRELLKLIDFYIENPDIEPCSMLEMGITNIGTTEDEALRFCGAGLSMHSYDVDGRVYPCQFFMPLSVGEEKAKKANEIVFPESVIAPELLDEKCRDCVIRSACPNCYGSNYASTGNIFNRDDNMCKLTKLILKARSYFRALQWKKGQLKGNEDEIQATLNAIIKIQENLKI